MNWNSAIVDPERLPIRAREAWLHRMAGKTARQTAVLMDCTKENVYSLWHWSRKRAGNPLPPKAQEFVRVHVRERQMVAAGRCRCGLLLPCHSCIPTLAELATSRCGESFAIGPSPVGSSGNARNGSRVP